MYVVMGASGNTGGVVAENGSHDELIARNGIYAGLHRTQFETGPAKVEA